MNLSAEKRKMPRMQVGFPAYIFLGMANNRSDVNIQDLSIHGISFRYKKYLTRGTQFNLIISHDGKKAEREKIQAEVVRCETLNGFSSGGKFKVGAKFLFKAHKPAESKENSTTDLLFPLQPFDSVNSLQKIHEEKLKNYPVQTYARGTLSPSACRIRINDIHAEHIQLVTTSAREEIVYTSIHIKQARIISSPSTSSSKLIYSEESRAGIDNNSPGTHLARQNFPDKQLS